MAGSNVISLLLDFKVDDKDLTKGLAGAQKQVQASAMKMAQSFKNVGKKAMIAGGVMTAGITAPLIGVGKQLVSLATDLEETHNKVNVVFGDSADVIHDFARSAATDLGLTIEAAEASAALSASWSSHPVGRSR